MGGGYGWMILPSSAAFSICSNRASTREYARFFVYFQQNFAENAANSVDCSSIFLIDAVGKLVYYSRKKFERYFSGKEANAMTFRNTMMMRMLFSRACNMARCFGMRCCSPENNA